MRLSVKGLAIGLGLLWGLSTLVVALVHLGGGGYGGALLDLERSIYPGYHGPAGFGSVIVVTLYAFVDGLIGGALLAWFYNAAAGGGPAA